MTSWALCACGFVAELEAADDPAAVVLPAWWFALLHEVNANNAATAAAAVVNVFPLLTLVSLRRILVQYPVWV